MYRGRNSATSVCICHAVDALLLLSPHGSCERYNTVAPGDRQHLPGNPSVSDDVHSASHFRPSGTPLQLHNVPEVGHSRKVILPRPVFLRLKGQE